MMIKVAVWTVWLKSKMTDERGAGLAEYALLLFVIAVAVAGVVNGFGGMISGLFDQATTDLPTPPPAP